jgi:hypothetical protein
MRKQETYGTLFGIRKTGKTREEREGDGDGEKKTPIPNEDNIHLLKRITADDNDIHCLFALLMVSRCRNYLSHGKTNII